MLQAPTLPNPETAPVATTLASPAESARAEKLRNAIEKASLEQAQLDAEIAERQGAWARHCAAVEGATARARVARSHIAHLEQEWLPRHLEYIRGMAGSKDQLGEWNRVAREVAMEKGCLPLLEAACVELEQQAAAAVESAKKFAEQNNIPKASWPAQLQ